MRALAPTIAKVLTHLAVASLSFCDNLRLLDSAPVPCGQWRETARRSELAGHAGYGWCASFEQLMASMGVHFLRPDRKKGAPALVALRLLSVAAGLIHNQQIGTPGRHVAAYGR